MSGTWKDRKGGGFRVKGSSKKWNKKQSAEVKDKDKKKKKGEKDQPENEPW
jgi:hypothetical protein